MYNNYFELLKVLTAPGEIQEALLQYFKDANGGELPPNAKKLAPIAYYDQFTLAGVQRFDLFEGVFAVTRTNLNGGSFIPPQGEDKLILGTRVYEGNAVAVEDTLWDAGAGILKTGQLNWDNNGDTAMTDYPIARAIDALTTSDIGVIPFPFPQYWKGQQPFTGSIEWDLAAVAGDNARIELFGVGLVSG